MKSNGTRRGSRSLSTLKRSARSRYDAIDSDTSTRSRSRSRSRRDRYLPRGLPQERPLRRREGASAQAAEPDRPEPARDRRQREDRKRLHADVAQHRAAFRESTVVLGAPDHDRFLRREGDAAIRRVDGQLEARRNPIRVRGTDHVDAHALFLRVVQEERNHLEGQQGRQPPRQIAKERRQVAVRRDGL
jgi:hypothetical protein